MLVMSIYYIFFSLSTKNQPVHEVFVSPSLVQQTAFSTARVNWLVMGFVYLLHGY